MARQGRQLLATDRFPCLRATPVAGWLSFEIVSSSRNQIQRSSPFASRGQRLAKLLGIGAAEKHEITVAGTGEVVYTLALDRALGEEQAD